MRKRLISATPKRVRPEDEGWMDMDTSAVIAVSAEQKDYPIDSALLTGEAQGWRALNRELKLSGSCLAFSLTLPRPTHCQSHCRSQVWLPSGYHFC